MRRYILSISLLLWSFTLLGQAAKYNLSFQNGSLEPDNKFCVDLGISFDAAGKLGSSNLVFTYDDSKLANPGIAENYLSGPPFYQNPSLSEPVDGRVSYNIELSVSGFGDAIESNPQLTLISKVCFDRIDTDTGLGLEWYVDGTLGTVVYIDNEATQLSPEVLEDLPSLTLPVELTSFEVEQVGKDALLSWETEIEINNSHFDIERSIDGLLFTKIGQQAGQGTTDNATQYEFLDKNIVGEGLGTYYYRLRQVDHDGSLHYSPVVELRIAQVGEPFSRAYPGPFDKNIIVEFVNPEATLYELQISNSIGQIMWSLETKALKGKQSVEASNWAAGIYFLQTNHAGGKQIVKLVKL